MINQPIFVGCVWTESRPERRDLLDRTLAPIAEDSRFDIHWLGSEDVAKAGGCLYFRDDAEPYAGLSASRAWLVLRRNAQTTRGSSRRSSVWIARVAAAWNLLRLRRLDADAPPSEFMDDCTSKHLLGLDRFVASDSDWLLGLEDDAIADSCWPERLLGICKLVSEQSEEPVFVAVSEGAGLLRTSSDPKPDSLGLFRVSPPATRTACAYLMNKAAARLVQSALLSSGVRPNEGSGFDFLTAFVFARSPVSVYWTEPPVFLHGSEREVPGLESHRFEDPSHPETL